MKKTILTLGLAAIVSITVHAGQYTTFSPNFGGGYRFNSYGDHGYSYGNITPNFGGGYRFNGSNANGHYSYGTVTPNFGGGFSEFHNTWTITVRP